MSDNAVSNNESKITVTGEAVGEIKRLMADEKEPNLYLRLSVAAGGCSGMSYTMAFDTNKQEIDREFEFDGVRVLVDSRALNYLNGSVLHYKGGMLGGGFHFENPNARRSCGCGSSFSC